MPALPEQTKPTHPNAIPLIGYSAAAGFVLTEPIDPTHLTALAARRARQEAILTEVAPEESEAAEAEAAVKSAALDVPMHLRIDRDLALRQRAAALSADVENIARRVAREALQQH